MKGVGMSVFQNSSDTHSNWIQFAKKKKFFGQQDLQSAWSKSNNFWEMYEQDIRMAKETLGTNSFRFSFEWARIEPTGPGKVDQAAVDKYRGIIDAIYAAGMEPMVTLHHFTHPQWFEDMGGFEKEDNIPLFLDYCRRVFSWFGPRIKLWATFNEPTCFAFVGYIAGLWCPGQVMKFKKGGQVLGVLLKAHVVVYEALKAMPGGQQACIGLVHQHIKFVPKSRYTPHIRLLCKWMTYWFASETILKFFSTGIFEWKAPWKGVVLRFAEPRAPHTIDWWGINYYSSPCVNWWFNMGSSDDNEPVSDIKFRLYPQGLYNAVADASILGRPIYITETGLADKHSRHRNYFINSHLPMVLKCIQDGYDVRGIYFWTLMDNIEWHEGFHVKFGLYEWDPVQQRSKGLTLRPGGECLPRIYNSWPDRLDELQGYARKMSDRGGDRLALNVTAGPVQASHEETHQLLQEHRDLLAAHKEVLDEHRRLLADMKQGASGQETPVVARQQSNPLFNLPLEESGSMKAGHTLDVTAAALARPAAANLLN
eukprot:CAMPEP_0202896722 /NCGR_PEP_ID=MMETSP1392-20130828/5659_1 /ASSEMBLY_ACC=CAM_ASM_000868 /TAXON_ID=225041 /ORGANISM="Chlamydomonas chlamydogama, Strain SAG 11-48b" /LENGTH=537 /DNA_ID=CAMNT_0049582169 /DNA_START=105 /DNA_END=1718 /DNA_ORIENTATION=+